jgi:FAD synthase
VRFLRDEVKFSGIEALKRQIAQDIAGARALFARRCAHEE